MCKKYHHLSQNFKCDRKKTILLACDIKLFDYQSKIITMIVNKRQQEQLTRFLIR